VFPEMRALGFKPARVREAMIHQDADRLPETTAYPARPARKMEQGLRSLSGAAIHRK